MSRMTCGLPRPWTLLCAMCSTAVFAAPQHTEQIRQVTIIQDMVVGLGPGQSARLTLAPEVYDDFDARAVVINVRDERGELLATTGRRPVGPDVFGQVVELAFRNVGDPHRLVRFEYQLAGRRLTGAATRAADGVTRPLAPGTLEIRDPDPAAAPLVLPVPALTPQGTAASCALPSEPASAAARQVSVEAEQLVVGEFPLVRVGDRQALHFTLADAVPEVVRARAELAAIVKVFSRTGEAVTEVPETRLDGRRINEWVFGTELPRAAPAGAEFFVRYIIMCRGECDTLADWIGRAQPVGPPLTPGLHLVAEDTGGTLIGMLLPAVQKVRDSPGGGGGGDPTPPPPPPNT